MNRIALAVFPVSVVASPSLARGGSIPVSEAIELFKESHVEDYHKAHLEDWTLPQEKWYRFDADRNLL